MADERPSVIVQPSPGVVGVASDTIGALKAAPLLLVMVLLNMAFIGAAAYYLRNQQDKAFDLMGSIFEHCLPAVKQSRLNDAYLPSPLNPLTSNDGPP